MDIEQKFHLKKNVFEILKKRHIEKIRTAFGSELWSWLAFNTVPISEITNHAEFEINRKTLSCSN